MRSAARPALAAAYARRRARRSCWRAARRRRWPPAGGSRVPAVAGARPPLAGALRSRRVARGPPPPAPGELVVSFLDVGQGDATLLQHGGATLLVDTGPPGGPILRRLREAGVERLDALLVTHA